MPATEADRIEHEIRLMKDLHQGQFTAGKQMLDVQALEIELKANLSLQAIMAGTAESETVSASGRKNYGHVIELVRDAESGFPSSARDNWLNRVGKIYCEVELALSWALAQDSPELSLELAGLLTAYWFFTDKYVEGLEWLEKALVKAGESMQGTEVALARFGAGLLYRAKGNIHRAWALLNRSVDLFAQEVEHVREPKEREFVLKHYAFALAFLALTERDRAEHPSALQHVDESFRLFSEHSDTSWGRWGAALSCTYRGILRLAAGRAALKNADPLPEVRAALDEAVKSLEAGRAQFGDLKDLWGIAQARIYSGVAEYQRALWAEKAHSSEREKFEEKARGHFKAYLEFLSALPESSDGKGAVIRTIDNKRGLARCLCGLALIANKQKKPDVALRLLGAAEALRKELHGELVVNDITDYMDTFQTAYADARRHPNLPADARSYFLFGERMSVTEAIEYALRYTLPIHEIHVEPLVALPETTECDFCGGSIVQTTTRQEFWTKSKMFQAALASYRCEQCGVESIRLEGYIDFMAKVLAVLEKEGEKTDTKTLRAELARARLHQETLGVRTVQ